MAMPFFLTALLILSLVFGCITGQLSAVSAAAMAGAQAAVELCLSMAGAICLWSGVMTLMERCGLSQKLARLLRPVLRRRGQRRAVPPCGAEHRIHPATAHHRGRRPQRPRLHCALRHPALRVALLGAVGGGGTAGGTGPAGRMEALTWT